MNLANKYRPHTWEDVTEQDIVVDILQNMCNAENLDNRNFLLTGPAGCGKAQPLTSKILTRQGFVQMKDVYTGLEVYTHTGDIGKITGIYPQGIRKIYRITLEDDTYIEVSDDHINIVAVRDLAVDLTPTILYADTRYVQSLIDSHTSDVYIPAPVLGDIADILSEDESMDLNHRLAKPFWKIKSIEYVRDDDCQCIMVNHLDHTYISDNFIPTHNTTMGRIIANTINEGHGDPIEIDAASHSGVDSVRDIVQQAQTYPVGMKYKVFIVDEAHAMSNAAWQAFLKALEDAPARSVFVFCTTDPEKIPATILSRVQVFRLSKISLDGIHKRLVHVLDSEIAEGNKITYTDDAINLIAKLANGGMRDSLTLLDKVLAFGSDITSESVVKALNLPNYEDYFSLLTAYAKQDNVAITDIINSVYDSGVNFLKWFESFHAFVIQILKFIFLRDIHQTTIPAHYADKIESYTSAHALICLKLANVLVKLNYEMKSTQYQQELALTHLLFAKK